MENTVMAGKRLCQGLKVALGEFSIEGGSSEIFVDRGLSERLRQSAVARGRGWEAESIGEVLEQNPTSSKLLLGNPTILSICGGNDSATPQMNENFPVKLVAASLLAVTCSWQLLKFFSGFLKSPQGPKKQGKGGRLALPAAGEGTLALECATTEAGTKDLSPRLALRVADEGTLALECATTEAGTGDLSPAASRSKQSASLGCSDNEKNVGAETPPTTVPRGKRRRSSDCSGMETNAGAETFSAAACRKRGKHSDRSDTETDVGAGTHSTASPFSESGHSDCSDAGSDVSREAHSTPTPPSRRSRSLSCFGAEGEGGVDVSPSATPSRSTRSLRSSARGRGDSSSNALPRPFRSLRSGTKSHGNSSSDSDEGAGDRVIHRRDSVHIANSMAAVTSQDAIPSQDSPGSCENNLSGGMVTRSRARTCPFLE